MRATESTEWKKTACIICALNCGLEVQTDGRRIVRIRGDKAHPISQGYVCEKSQRMDYYQNGADRLESPMRRKPDGTYEAIDWETAIREIAAKFSAIKARHGGESILYYGGGSQGNHLGGVYGDSTIKALGIQYRSNALAQEKTGEAWVQGKMTGSGIHGDFEHCEVAVFVGKNPWQSHGFARTRVILREIQNDPARTLIVIDPEAQRDRRDGRHSPRRPPRNRCMVPRGARRHHRAAGPRRADVDRRAHDRLRTGRGCPAANPGVGLRRHLRSRRSAVAPGGRAHRSRRQRLDDRRPRRADEPALDARQLPESTRVDAHRSLRAAGHQQCIRAVARTVAVEAGETEGAGRGNSGGARRSSRSPGPAAPSPGAGSSWA